MPINQIDTAEHSWLLEKKGMFSASAMHKLLSKGTGSEMFGKGALTYIEEVACDAYTEFEEGGVETYDMKMGKVREPQAFGHFFRLLGFDGLVYHGDGNPVFKKYCKDSGCSPDCLAPMADGKISFGAEFKCNKRMTHFRTLRDIAAIGPDLDDHVRYLKSKQEDDFTQCQFSMMCYKCDLWNWCSYNEFFPFESQMLIIQVPADKIFQQNLAIRLKNAIKMKYEIIADLKKTFGN